jgi:hypothetical protein
MQRLSSKWTLVSKRIFPVFWVVILAAFSIPMILAWRSGATVDPGILIVPIVATAIGYFVMKRTVFNLVDEVWDRGDDLLVRNKGQEDRIPLADIMNVSYTMFGNNRRATLKLRTPCRFGSEVAFMPVAPAWRFTFFKNPILEELIDRIDAARRRKA